MTKQLRQIDGPTQQILINWWKAPDLEGYLIEVPRDASETDIEKAVQQFAEELTEYLQWQFAHDDKPMGNWRDTDEI